MAERRSDRVPGTDAPWLGSVFPLLAKEGLFSKDLTTTA